MQLERAGRGVARVGEEWLVVGRALVVELGEVAAFHIDLAADFAIDPRLPQPEGNGGDGAGVGGDFVRLGRRRRE